MDDLDRCESRAIVETFDAVRLVMVIPEVVLIIGIDARIAFRAGGSPPYRALTDDATSPEVLNACLKLCLKLAGRGELCLDPENYDDV